jgi:hypothetical protein
MRQECCQRAGSVAMPLGTRIKFATSYKNGFDWRIVGKPEVDRANISKDPGCCGGQDRQECPVLLQFANPDVAIAHWVIVVLQG